MSTDREPLRVLYEFNLTCGHLEWIEVDARYMPANGVYVCPVCGEEEFPLAAPLGEGPEECG